MVVYSVFYGKIRPWEKRCGLSLPTDIACAGSLFAGDRRRRRYNVISMLVGLRVGFDVGSGKAERRKRRESPRPSLPDPNFKPSTNLR